MKPEIIAKISLRFNFNSTEFNVRKISSRLNMYHSKKENILKTLCQILCNIDGQNLKEIENIFWSKWSKWKILNNPLAFDGDCKADFCLLTPNQKSYHQLSKLKIEFHVMEEMYAALHICTWAKKQQF